MSIIQRARLIYQLAVVFLIYYPAAFLVVGAGFLVGGVGTAQIIWNEVNLSTEVTWKNIKEEWKLRGKTN